VAGNVTALGIKELARVLTSRRVGTQLKTVLGFLYCGDE